MIAISIPSIDPVWLAAFFVAASLAIAHLVFLPGYFVRRDLPRTVSYAIGLGAVGVGFTLLYLFGRPAVVDHLRPIADFWILTVAGAIPTIGFRVLKRSADNASALEAMNGNQ